MLVHSMSPSFALDCAYAINLPFMSMRNDSFLIISDLNYSFNKFHPTCILLNGLLFPFVCLFIYFFFIYMKTF